MTSLFSRARSRNGGSGTLEALRRELERMKSGRRKGAVFAERAAFIRARRIKTDSY
jgi:hypothetical protein